MERYVAPAIVAAICVAAVFLVVRQTGHTTKAAAAMKPALVHPTAKLDGRVLSVVVEEHLVYVGEDFTTFDTLDQFLRDKISPLRPDCALVIATNLARHGPAIRVHTSVNRVLGIMTELQSLPVPSGWRCPPITVFRDGEPL